MHNLQQSNTQTTFIRDIIIPHHIDAATIRPLSSDIINMLNTFTTDAVIHVRHNRQVGVTTSTLAYIVMKMITKPHQHIVIISPTDATSIGTIAAIKTIHANLPECYHIPVNRNTKREFGLINGSFVFRVLTPNSLRGRSPSLLVVDQPNNIKNQKGWVDTILPTVHAMQGQFITTSSDHSNGPMSTIDGATVVTVRG